MIVFKFFPLREFILGLTYNHELCVLLVFARRFFIYALPSVLVMYFLTGSEECDIFCYVVCCFVVLLFAVLHTVEDYSEVNKLSEYCKFLSGNNYAPTKNDSLFNTGIAKIIYNNLSSLGDVIDRESALVDLIYCEFNFIFNAISDLVVVTDASLQIIRRNNSAGNFFGEDNEYTCLYEYMKDQNLLQKISQSICKGECNKYIGEYRVVNEDGRECFFSVIITTILLYKYKTPNAIILFRDITIQKETERILRDFVANAGHEIRTPLTALIGFAETAQENIINNDKEHAIHFIDIALRQGHKISDLLSSLLALAKADYNKEIVLNDNVDMIRVVFDAVNTCRNLAECKNINLIVNYNESDVYVIKGDAVGLTQIANNLITNAIEYSNIDSDVLLNIRRDESKKYIQLSVTDSGCGIGKADIERLTERFYRGKHSGNRKGSGLGLSIVQSILERHGGYMKIDSVEGQYSIFNIFLPLSLEA